MEVHHHSHTGHKKKRWIEYLFEFFMLFLAVFCGFLAEYKLELTIEHEKEEQYMRSMLEDLKTDTTKLAANIRIFDVRIAQQDTVLKQLFQFKEGFKAGLFQ